MVRISEGEFGYTAGRRDKSAQKRSEVFVFTEAAEIYLVGATVDREFTLASLTS